MNIHEYQGKSILKSFGVAIQEGILAETPDQAVEAAKELKLKYNSDWVVVKAQIHAGGRGKGGGIKLAKNLDEVKEKASQILGMYLITPQTSAKGKLVNKVLITQDVYYKGASETKEFYMSVLLNRAKGRNTIIYSTEGGMDIEHVAEHTPDKIWKEEIDPRIGIQAFQTRKIAFNLGLSGNAFKEMVKFVSEGNQQIN
jgi:succinyl-CoA synthetase beta subunit